jgi:hypothetical protein
MQSEAPPHCEPAPAGAAIQLFWHRERKMDCFAPLAMTHLAISLRLA